MPGFRGKQWFEARTLTASRRRTKLNAASTGRLLILIGLVRLSILGAGASLRRILACEMFESDGRGAVERFRSAGQPPGEPRVNGFLPLFHEQLKGVALSSFEGNWARDKIGHGWRNAEAYFQKDGSVVDC
jgi:hypothetical protein